MLVVGITGGIGSGKSAVSDRFAALGVPVIDADHSSRDVVARGSSGLAEVVAHFGQEVLTEDGELDRKALGQLIFSDVSARRKLEAILHPRIRAAMRDQLAKVDGPYAVLVIPLLIESKQQDLVDRILVVDTPEALQRRRVQARDGISASHIDRILAAQLARTERLKAADDVIVNDGDLVALDNAVARQHAKYLSFATAGSDPTLRK